MKSKFNYNSLGIGFDGEDSWSFGNGFAKNIVIFGVNNSSSSHTDKKKNNFLVFSEEPTDSINGSTVQHKKNWY